MKYTLTIYLTPEIGPTKEMPLVPPDIINMEVEYDKEYDLRKDITIMGNNGITRSDGNHYIFYPPHRIIKIEANGVTP